MKKFSVIILIFVFSWSVPKSEAQDSSHFQWKVGESLTYQVKWAFIQLGEINLQIVSLDTLHGQLAYHCRMTVDSSPKLPFITIHDVYHSFIDADSFYSHLYLSNENKNDYTIFTRYEFDPVQKDIHIHIEKQREQDTEVVLDSLAIVDKLMFDSYALLMLARAQAKIPAEKNVFLFVYKKFEESYIHFTGTQDRVEIHDTEINCFYLEGRLKFIGIAGVKEDFKGWFSPDSQSIPVKAAMKAFIGSVNIYLNHWKNWENDSTFFKP